MKRKNKMLAAALVTALLLCLLPATALATATPSPAPTAAATPQATAEATPEPAAETPEATAALLPDGTEAAYNEADQTLYAAAGSVTYNNGGTVYNNGGTVYNNAGLVYNNGGLVYNNAGTVYSNGGTVYNNAGQVFNNGAIVYTNAGDTADSVISGYYRVSLGGDYSAFADITGLDAEPGAGGYLIAKDAVCTITPKAGFTVSSAEASAGVCAAGEDGSYTLSAVDAETALTLSFKAEAPVFGLAAGTYAKAQTLELSAAAEGAVIYYSTDGSEPTAESEKYTAALKLDAGTTVKAVAIAEGAEASDTVTAAYAVPKLTGPEFDAVSEGYKQPAAQGIVVDNSGSADARIKSVIVSGDDAASFILSRTAGGRVSAGAKDSTSWTIQPLVALKAGSYSATVTFTYDSGDTAQVKISFTVK